MRLIRATDYYDMSRKAANLISAQMVFKKNSVLGLATGSTPLGIYKQLVEWYEKGALDFSEITTVNLDEYRGITKENEQSYYYYMQQNLFRHVNLKAERAHLPDGANMDSAAECNRYEELIHALGDVDIQLLGLGHNGHIGFNEPGDCFERDVHMVNLSEQTIEANKRFFESYDEVPKQAYTMGIGTILRAKKIVLAVSGEDKAEILRAVMQGPITPRVPGSVLQLHTDVFVVADEAAAKLL